MVVVLWEVVASGRCYYCRLRDGRYERFVIGGFCVLHIYMNTYKGRLSLQQLLTPYYYSFCLPCAVGVAMVWYHLPFQTHNNITDD